MHIYYAMKNCNGDSEELRNYMVSIIDHYKGDHSKCHKDSRCHEEGYVCSKKPLVSDRAIAAYRKAIEGTTIYKNASDYAQNENVLRETSSEQFYQSSRQPDRIAPHRVLVEETFHFKDSIWALFYNSL